MNPLNSSLQVVTVALNPALDQTIEVAGLQPGAVNRALRMQVDVGGKAINVASCLADFGINAAVTGQLGRDNAALFEELFRRKKIANHCCYLDGLTRINTKLVDVERGETTDLNMPGPELTAEAAAELLDQVLQRLDALMEQARWVVLSGSLLPGMPEDAYATLTRRIQAAGAAVLLDTSGSPLRAALTAGPRLIKPNRHELAELVGEPLESLEALLAAGRALLNSANPPEWVVVSLGSDGALFLSREQALQAHPAPVAVTSTVGAGDAMVAGLVAARLENLALAETAQLATAFAAAKLTRLGPHLPPPDQVRALAQQIAVTPLD
ncbi:1-phosphofructokinase [Candidatus Contendibacter odensensis]|uniref:Phosphofructokinase n=1 Tax=Candidatus Contendobacter odensis Run_B_J11 TaxID=1400861 RepID=A0A7U7GEC8_9GAMM|nr:1-phosphofructokinase [Candidatus Contendobacter odensis]MBK8751473.1 1-phosphofructokinase [Candidatus Competibacteraceae bacterium]CDH46714.1 Fructose-1-phosphate kinase [Candidatus Contendobacter odensis Run_B_J11]